MVATWAMHLVAYLGRWWVFQTAVQKVVTRGTEWGKSLDLQLVATRASTKEWMMADSSDLT